MRMSLKYKQGKHIKDHLAMQDETRPPHPSKGIQRSVPEPYVRLSPHTALRISQLRIHHFSHAFPQNLQGWTIVQSRVHHFMAVFTQRNLFPI